MRTYQRLAFARGGTELPIVNPAYPHNFLITNSRTGTLKIGSTGTRYNDLVAVGDTAPEEFVQPQSFTEPMPGQPSEELNDELPIEAVWAPKRKTTKRKKVADDSESLI